MEVSPFKWPSIMTAEKYSLCSYLSSEVCAASYIAWLYIVVVWCNMSHTCVEMLSSMALSYLTCQHLHVQTIMAHNHFNYLTQAMSGLQPMAINAIFYPSCQVHFTANKGILAVLFCSWVRYIRNDRNVSLTLLESGLFDKCLLKCMNLSWHQLNRLIYVRIKTLKGHDISQHL